MYVNVAYLHGARGGLVDKTEPLLVTSCGNYRLKTRPKMATSRPGGREDYQLLYVASGKGHFFINGAERVLGTGVVVVYFPGQRQEYVYLKEDKPDVYWVHFTGADAGEILKSYGLDPAKNILPGGVSPRLPMLFEEMIGEMQLCRPKFQEMTTLLLRDLLICVYRAHQLPQKVSPSSEQAVAKAVAYFGKNYAKDISVEEYARNLGFGKSYFQQCFRELTGESPLQYILKLRLAAAQSLLENTPDPVCEIAEQVGFRDALYFSRLFRKHLGLSPREYRKARRVS